VEGVTFGTFAVTFGAPSPVAKADDQTTGDSASIHRGSATTPSCPPVSAGAYKE